jgi:hypothetical protein
VHRQHVRGTLEAVAECAQYPDSSSAAVLNEAEASTPEAREALEAETAAAARRLELFVLFRNAAKVAPEEGYAVLGGLLQQLVSQPNTGFQVSSLVDFCWLAERPGWAAGCAHAVAAADAWRIHACRKRSSLLACCTS